MRGSRCSAAPENPPEAGPVLGIDTAGRSGSVAIASAGKVELLSPLSLGRTYAEGLAPEILRMLEILSLEPGNLSGVAVSAGPGSFTGLRIAIGTALGLVGALGIPLVGVETMRAWALALGPRPEGLCPVLDAGKGLVFAAFFGWEDGRLVRRSEDLVLSPEALCGRLEGPTWIWGDGAERFGEVIRRLGKGRGRLILREDWPAAAGEVALCGGRRILRGEVSAPAGFHPRYVREAEAKVQWGLRYEGKRGR